MRSITFSGFVLAVALSSLTSLRAYGGDADKAERPSTSAAPSPIGVWRTIDDATGKAKSLVVISEQDGELSGRIERLLDAPPDDPQPKCDQCTGELKDAPILGMRILWGLRWDGEKWSGGKVLDPDNGKTYRCFISMEGGNDKLKLRGFIGISLLGRTQYWLRERPGTRE